ncbi:hypothetical protein [Bifidobacterium callitrichidarum]|uniref:Uncharacterized protein n=1 Tax=Bifidobacterium callitrichidarum TaxID=2052941 RepID=A0A2U2N439_9BIFI|nr:hypothetical protein [Bifidobacterium callitrichidarum]PWG63843.1 hypothetical protein DF196_10015 [Bifidobacterium callitrichidarum]
MTMPAGPRPSTRELTAMYRLDVDKPRRDARALAGDLLRAAAYAMQGGAESVTFRVPGSPETAAVQAASMLRIAQELHPIPADVTHRWDRPSRADR